MISDRKTRTRERILDSAYALVSRVGLRRTTFEDVAAKAGVSRQTLYRYFGSKDEMVAALMDREADRFLEELQKIPVANTDLAGAMSKGLMFTFDYLASHPLLSWIHEHEPDELLPHLRSHWLPILAAVRHYIEPFMEAEVSEGRMTARRAQMAGDWLSRIAMSYLIVPGDFVNLRDERSIAEVPDLILNGLRG
jgi:AcrR family transcriptional regulator